jgi:hypothetical protein
MKSTVLDIVIELAADLGEDRVLVAFELRAMSGDTNMCLLRLHTLTLLLIPHLSFHFFLPILRWGGRGEGNCPLSQQ